MARIGLARLADSVFDKDGRQIPYRIVRLTPAGRAANGTTAPDFLMKEGAVPRQSKSVEKESSVGSQRQAWCAPGVNRGSTGGGGAAGLAVG